MSTMDFDQLQSMTAGLDIAHQGCDVRISELRSLMDLACDKGHISIREWRMLLDKVAAVQGKLRMR